MNVSTLSRTALASLMLASFASTGCSIPDRLQTPFQPGLYKQVLERQKAGDQIDQEMVTELPELGVEDYERIGDQFYGRGEYGMALIKYQHGLELAPDHISLRYKFGSVILAKGFPRDSLEQFNRLAEQPVGRALGDLGRGQAWFQLGEYARAEEALLRAAAASPDLWKAHETLGLVLDRTGRHAEAVQAYGRALALRPGDRSVLNNMGVSLYLVGRYADSATTLEQAARTDPKNLRVQKNLARAYAKSRRYHDALDAYRRAEGPAEAYNYLGELFLADGRMAKARACFEEAIEMSPRYYETANENLMRLRRIDPSYREGTLRMASHQARVCP
ncbi:MAG: Flp pilus assembly protein TadD [Hyphomicrobiaceae bacterium]|jgi:Flp pilus assembly protein TadD